MLLTRKATTMPPLKMSLHDRSDLIEEVNTYYSRLVVGHAHKQHASVPEADSSLASYTGSSTVL